MLDTSYMKSLIDKASFHSIKLFCDLCGRRSRTGVYYPRLIEGSNEVSLLCLSCHEVEELHCEVENDNFG